MYQAGNKWLEAKEEDLAEPLDVRFRLWMDTAAFPKFRRIWGKASEEHGKLAAQVLEVAVQSHYNVSSFGGRKALVIAEESTFPKSARLLGTLYLCAAGVMILSATFALIVNRRQSRID
jgi:hypothetical protein